MQETGTLTVRSKDQKGDICHAHSVEGLLILGPWALRTFMEKVAFDSDSEALSNEEGALEEYGSGSTEVGEGAALQKSVGCSYKSQEVEIGPER